MVKTKKIKVFRYAIFQAIIMAFAGLVAGLIYSVGGFFIDALVSMGWITSTETPGLSYGTVLAFGAIIGMPLYFALFGFIAGIVGAFLYNLFLPKFANKINLNFSR